MEIQGQSDVVSNHAHPSDHKLFLPKIEFSWENRIHESIIANANTKSFAPDNPNLYLGLDVDLTPSRSSYQPRSTIAFLIDND